MSNTLLSPFFHQLACVGKVPLREKQISALFRVVAALVESELSRFIEYFVSIFAEIDTLFPLCIVVIMFCC